MKTGRAAAAALAAAVSAASLAWGPGGARVVGAGVTEYGGAVAVARAKVCLGQVLEASLPIRSSGKPILWSLDSKSLDIVYPLLDAQGTAIRVRLPASLKPGSYTLAADVQPVLGETITDYLSARPVDVCGSAKLANALASGQVITPFALYDDQEALWTFARGDFGQGQTIALYEASGVKTPDLNAFDQLFGLPPMHLQMVTPNGKPGLVAGYQNEATMDIEWAHAMAPDARLVVYAYKRPTIQSIASAIRSAAEDGDLSFSTSVVQPDFVNNSEAYLRRVELFNDTTVATATEEGLGIFSAAGDHGGVTPQSSNAPGHFSWPAGNDYVVAVGGTEWSRGREAYWNSGTQRGELWAGAWGYTDNTSVAEWQSAEWNDLGLGAPSSRYVPDVSMVANNALVVEDGKVDLDGGTSLAAPLWAAVWSLAENWHIRTVGAPIPASAPAALYALGQDASLALPAYLDQSAFATAPFAQYTGFGSPNVTDLIQDLVTLYP